MFVHIHISFLMKIICKAVFFIVYIHVYIWLVVFTYTFTFTFVGGIAVLICALPPPTFIINEL